MTFEDELLALERRVLIDSAGDFLTAVAELRRMLAADHPGILDRLAALAIPSMEQAAKDGVEQAWQAGGAEAVSDAEIALHVTDNAVGDARLRVDAGPPRQLTDPLDGLDALLADARARSLALIRSGAAPEDATAPIFGAANTARLRVVTQINAASNAAAVEVGDTVRSPMVWEAERDACVYCLALAGEVIQTPGDTFPPADLYADPPPSQWTVSRPPLHGHCRCRISLLVSPDYADALKREAQRSVLRGHSLASESQTVRIRAASRLLDRDPIAPQSVKNYARQAVKRGYFPKGRDAPVGDPRLRIN